MLKYIIPVVAVLVIAESVYLVSSLLNNKVGMGEVAKVLNIDNTEEVTDSKMATLSVVSEAESYMVGEEVSVSVILNANSDFNADAVNIYVSYDPEMVEISDLEGGEAMPKATVEKISDKKNMVVLNYYILDEGGMAFMKDTALSLANFKAKILKAGELNLNLSTGIEDEESATMIVENGTSREVPFDVNNLRVEIAE